jgi:hypothetical protein
VRAQEDVDAGDRWSALDNRERALSHYGRALDEYLREGLFGLASSVARRMIDRYPDVVRARMTLAALTLSEGLRHLSAGGIRNTCAAFREYVRAAQEAGQDELAIRHLRRFALATESPAVRARLGEFLSQLGDPQGTQALAPEPLSEEEDAVQSDADQRARWVEVLLS